MIGFDAPGLMGLLAFLGLDAIIPIAGTLFSIAIGVLLCVEFLNSKGKWHVREHARDMLPWMVAFPVFILVLGMIR